MSTKHKLSKEYTIIDVAKQAGVSKATVSRVLNNNTGVSEELEIRVKDAIKKLDFHPNRLARALKAKNSSSIGLIVPSVENPIFAQLTQVVETMAQKFGFSTILCNSEGRIEKEEEYMHLLLEKQVDGIIFDAAGEYADGFSRVIEQRVPIVLVGRKIEGFPVANIDADNRLGGNRATLQLIRTGCSKIIFMYAEHEAKSAINMRYLGYRDALDEHSIPIDERYIIKTHLTFESGAQATQKILDQKIPFDAIFASNDLVALGCLDTLIEYGIKVPEEVSVIGYDNITFGEMVRPRISTVSNQVQKIGTEAVKCLLRQIYSNHSDKEEVVIQPQLVIRQSTRQL